MRGQGSKQEAWSGCLSARLQNRKTRLSLAAFSSEVVWKEGRKNGRKEVREGKGGEGQSWSFQNTLSVRLDAGA